MFIEIHMIQNFAPSNLNRDDTNNPKDCEFGGVRRARISSQCIKRSIRMHPDFKKYTEETLSFRSRRLANAISTNLIKKGYDEQESFKNALVFTAELLGGFKNEDIDTGISRVIFFFTPSEIEDFVDEISSNWQEINQIVSKLDIEKHIVGKFTKQKERKLEKFLKSYIKKYKGEERSLPDIALYGRMLALHPELNMDAACQVAHAISTHRVNMDIDFFTAVDDLQQSDESGSAMMGVTGFNSACFYRYMRLHWEQLMDNLGRDAGLALKTVEGFLRAALSAVPTGKQNSFAAQNPPDFLLAVTRSDGACWSLANAFEKPATADYEHSLLENSILKADAYWGKLLKFYGGEVQPTAALLIDGLELPNLQSVLAENADAWVKTVLAQLPVQ